MPETLLHSRRRKSKSKSVIIPQTQTTTETKQRANKFVHAPCYCIIVTTATFLQQFYIWVKIFTSGKLLQCQLPVTLFCITNIVL